MLLVPWAVQKMSEPPTCILSLLIWHVCFSYLLDAADPLQPLQQHSNDPNKSWDSRLTLWIQSLQIFAQRPFRKGRMVSKIQQSWHFDIICIFQAHTFHREEKKKKEFSLGISIILPTFQPIASSICRNSGRPSHMSSISLFPSVGWKMPLSSTIKSTVDYTHVSAVYHPLSPPFGQLTRENDLYSWSIHFI